MSLKVKCPKGCKLRVPNRRNGTVIRCPKCRAIIRVPSTEGMPKGGELITLKAELVSEAYSPENSAEPTQESLREQWRLDLGTDQGGISPQPDSTSHRSSSHFETPFRIDEPVLAEHHIDEAAVEHQHDPPMRPVEKEEADTEPVSGGYADPHPERATPNTKSEVAAPPTSEHAPTEIGINEFIASEPAQDRVTRSRETDDSLCKPSEPPAKHDREDLTEQPAPAPETTSQEETSSPENALVEERTADVAARAATKSAPPQEVAKSDGSDSLQTAAIRTVKPDAPTVASAELKINVDQDAGKESPIPKQPHAKSIASEPMKPVEAHAQSVLLETQSSSDSSVPAEPPVSPSAEPSHHRDSSDSPSDASSLMSFSPPSDLKAARVTKMANADSLDVEPPPLSSDETLAAPPSDEFVLVEPPIDVEASGHAEDEPAMQEVAKPSTTPSKPVSVVAPKDTRDENRPVAKATSAHTLASENDASTSVVTPSSTSISRGEPDEWQESIGLVPDFAKQQASRAMAMVMVMAGIFTMGPAIFDLAIRWQQGPLVDVERWVFVLFFLGGVHFLYALYLAQLPDWSSMWVISILMLVLTCFDALCLGGLFIGSADGPIARALQITMERRSQAMLWVLCMMSIHALLSYFCGREASRWKSAFDVYVSTLE